MAVLLPSNAVGCGHVGGFGSFCVFWVPPWDSGGVIRVPSWRLSAAGFLRIAGSHGLERGRPPFRVFWVPMSKIGVFWVPSWDSGGVIWVPIRTFGGMDGGVPPVECRRMPSDAVMSVDLDRFVSSGYWPTATSSRSPMSFVTNGASRDSSARTASPVRTI